MGLRYRKSIKLGAGFRVNISKSGIGYSWGVPGYRITHTASGKKRTTVSIPGTGISYVSESSKKNTKTSSNRIDNPQFINVNSIDSGEIVNFQPVEYQDIIKKLQTIITLNQISSLAIWCLILCISPIFLTIGILGVISKVIIHVYGHVNLEYSFDDSPVSSSSKKRINSWKILKKSHRIWYINKIGTITNAKKVGGATSAFDRQLTDITYKLPFYLKSNLEIPIIYMKKSKETFIILPDLLMLIKKSKIGIIKYNDLKLDIYASGEICKDAPANDSKFLKKAWLYTNKDGSPDKRHKDNIQLPVYEIGRIDISSPSGLDVRLMISNTSILEHFKSEFESASSELSVYRK